MKPIKIVTIVGARPQFIKAAAVSRDIREFNEKKRRVLEVLVHTGQHYDYLMNGIFFEELELPKPDYHLGVGSGFHGRQTGLMLERIEEVLEKERPEVVLVYGDTNSTLAGALAAAKMNIPVAHVEAGLRSYNRLMPEEINRLLADHVSTFLFCPTDQSVRNLSKEGINDGKTTVVKKVGDVMYDSILYYSKIAEKKSTILQSLGLFNPQSGTIRPVSVRQPYRLVPTAIRHAPLRVHGSPEPHMVQGELNTPNYYLATLHRAENTDNPERLKAILWALAEVGRDVPVVLPLHPRTKKIIEAHRLLTYVKGIRVINPVSYLDMLLLEKHAKAILTDSGGVQKEAYWFGVPCFTLRDETEWVETVESGWNTLVGTKAKRIVGEVSRLVGKRRSLKRIELFGDGQSSQQIIRILIKMFDG